MPVLIELPVFCLRRLRVVQSQTNCQKTSQYNHKIYTEMLVRHLGKPAVLQNPKASNLPKILNCTLNSNSFLVATTCNKVKVDEL